MYSSSLNYGVSSSRLLGSGLALTVGFIVCLILAIVGGVVLYLTFLSKKNEHKFTGILGWLYDFLNFKNMILEMILKVLYLIIAGFITLYSVVILFAGPGNFGANFLSFLMFLIVGNIIVRVTYELLLMTIMLCRNVSDINKKLKKEEKNEPTHQNIPTEDHSNPDQKLPPEQE